jgi:hypothetical protein
VLVEAIEKNDLNGSSDRSRPLSSPPLEEEARATILRRVIAEASAAVTGRTRLRLARNDDAPVGQGAGAERIHAHHRLDLRPDPGRPRR